MGGQNSTVCGNRRESANLESLSGEQSRIWCERAYLNWVTKMASKATRPVASNGEIAREMWTSINEGDFSVIDTYVSEDYVEHDPNAPEEIHGREGFKQNIEQYFNAASDMEMTIEDLIEEDDKVSIRWTATGTHDGELMGISPTNNSITVTGLDINRFEDGMLVESWSSFDALGLMRQIGALPDETRQ